MLPILLPAAYLIGSIPFGFLLVLLVRREDIRLQGSGNIGATNVLRSGAKGLGISTFLLDTGKGYLAVALAEYAGRRWGASGPWLQNLAILTGLAAIAGHIFPVWLRFKGGKGVSTALGVFLALSPRAALAALAIFIVTFLLTRYVSLSSILAAIALPFLTLLLSPGVHTLLFRFVLFCCSFLVIFKHKSNIARLLRGAEYRFDKAGTTEA